MPRMFEFFVFGTQEELSRTGDGCEFGTRFAARLLVGRGSNSRRRTKLARVLEEGLRLLQFDFKHRIVLLDFKVLPEGLRPLFRTQGAYGACKHGCYEQVRFELLVLLLLRRESRIRLRAVLGSDSING